MTREAKEWSGEIAETRARAGQGLIFSARYFLLKLSVGIVGLAGQQAS